ncbi:MAG: T9SS type A sorting domain-containing protein [Sphingobacteriales bacterium]|nr:T9SS type A sorting domain-containing protein [Sphingobacteriales bacterium]
MFGTTPGTWWSDPNIVKNKRADFPNYFFGKEYSYQCNNSTIQGMTPGFGDSYGSRTPGNSIVLPCDLADGKYYVVLEIDPLGLYQESNENNNLAIIPITLDMPEAIPFSNDIIAGDELSHYQTAGDPSSQPVWSLNNRINGIVKVGAGITLTIQHCTLEFMTPESGIVVEKGGKLIVEHATLRGNECLGNVWKGIEVQGNGEIAQVGLGDTDPNHGLLQLDHATIRNAKIGVLLRATPVPPPQVLLWGGGGKVDAQNSQFIDCSVGIECRNQKFDNPSRINECQFLIDQGHSGTMRFPSIGHVGIYAYGVHTIPVTDCRFENLNPSNFTMEQRGVGIVAKSSNFIVGSTDSDEQGNEFVNLHKGIDAYSTNSLYGGMYIYNSQFDNVKRGITLNGCAMSEIAYNNFEVKIPGGYGVYALTSGGSTIAHNRFASHLPFDDTTPPQWAAVVSNAGNIYDTYVYDNYFTFGEVPPFDGQFYAATQIETPSAGQNRYVYIDCNEYAARSQYDLYIDDDTPAFSNQGGCEPADLNINPTANLWHTITGAAAQQHIYYANPNANFQITCLPDDYTPTIVSSNVEVYVCEGDENACDLFAEIGGDYAEKIANIRSRLLSTDLSDKEREALFAELLRSHVKARQYAAAKADLEARDLLSDRKLLVATYTNERELAAATTKLAQIPLDEQPDIDFYNLFTAIIDDLDTNPTPEYDDGSGKAAMPLPETVEEEALPNTKAATNIMAQSLKAQRQHTAYDRTPNYKTDTHQDQGEAAPLHIAPNPAQNSVLVVWELPYSNALLSLYDYTGKVVTQQNVSGKSSTIDISGLPNGILMTQLSQQGVIMATGKIIIIK